MAPLDEIVLPGAHNAQPEISDILRRLQWLCAEGEVLGRDRMVVRYVGHALHCKGGLKLMRAAFYDVVVAAPQRDEFSPGEVECAWDHIGMWRW